MVPQGTSLGSRKHFVIFPISHELIGIFNFVLLLCLKNKRAKEVHIFPYEGSHMIELCLWEEPLTWEEFCYELPIWRVFHFVWMIAWRLELHMGIKVPHIFSYVLTVAWGQETLGRGGL